MNNPSRGVGATVGAQIKRRREQRGLTAAELARRSGLGKGSLSSIEAGRGNPTIDTLDAIAFALRIPLTDLLGTEEEVGTIHRPGTERADDEVTRELFRRIGAGQSTEVWRLRMPPSTYMDGVPHSPGTVEHLIVASGRLTAGVTGETVDLSPGDMLSFPGDLPHSYRTDDASADVTVLMVSPHAG
ncbi:transcriptional regulator with XRE-family HTH domain [Rhodococcus sp. 27YEA15]|uniref:helix-turn-helix domain-containing protein n=1 Tax=Rhodococcus sp. 27YEA15 TaxID=3156259 RepID=UPI003C7A2F1E